MKKRLTILFVILMAMSMLLSTSMFSFGASAATTKTGTVTFENLPLGAVTAKIAIEDNEYFTGVGEMGSTTTKEIIKDDATGEVFYRSTSTADSGNGGGHYFYLQNVTAGKYTITITLRFSEGATLRAGKETRSRFSTDNGTDKVLDKLYEEATADATGFKTISFSKNLTKKYSYLRIYNHFTTGGMVDVKEITITHEHQFENYVPNNDATCTQNATETGTCICGEVDTREIADTKLDHTFVDGTCSCGAVDPNAVPSTPEAPADEGGCGSVIGATSAILSVVLLAGATIVLKKKD
ncbi:MAG: hypothetical protein E7342_05075 [Clostridiales bacterium]|nr:hypothetical protein [Clostridiales bacterium]